MEQAADMVGLNASYTLEQWMRLTGYPVVTVTVDNSTHQPTLSQRTYYESLYESLDDIRVDEPGHNS